MRILTNNYLPDATITVNNPEVLYPVTNMYNDILSEVTKYNGYITIDLGISKHVTALGLLNVTTGSTSAYDVTIEANTTDNWVSPAFSVVVDNKIEFIDETYRYWRITSTLGNKVGYFYLGEFLQMPGNIGGSVPNPIRNDVITSSQSKAIFITPGPVIRQQVFTFDTVSNKTEWDILNSYRNSIDYAHNHIFIQFEEYFDGNWYFEPYFANILMSGGSRSGNLFSMSMSVTEAK